MQILLVCFQILFWPRPDLCIECPVTLGGNKTFFMQLCRRTTFSKRFLFSETEDFCLIVSRYCFWVRRHVGLVCLIEFRNWNSFFTGPNALRREQILQISFVFFSFSVHLCPLYLYLYAFKQLSKSSTR